MSFVTLTTTLAAAVADDGTVTLAYPAGTNQAYFTGNNASADGVVVVNDNDVVNEGDPGITLTYGASNITLTNKTGAAWAAGTFLRVQLGRAGADAPGFAPGAAIASLTDSSGGTASGTLAAISGTYVQAEVRNSIASLNAKIDAILIALREAGIIAE